VARLLTLFKIRNVLSEAAGVHRLALVRVLNPINSGRFHLASGHIRVGKQSTGRDMRIVGIGGVIGQGHVIVSGERQWIVNHRIDLWTFNDIYINYNKPLHGIMYSIYAASTRPCEYYRINPRMFNAI